MVASPFYSVTTIHHSVSIGSQARSRFSFIEIGKTEDNSRVKMKPADFMGYPPVSNHYVRTYLVIIVLSSWPEQGRAQFPKY